MSDTPKTVFVTKYAAINDLVECEVLKLDGLGGGAILRWPGPSGGPSYFGPTEYEITREAAVSRANQMRDAKLTSLEKQVERLRGMVF